MKRSSWILIALFALAVGAYFLFNASPESEVPEAYPTQTPETFLLPGTDDTLTSIRIFNKQYDIVELQRDEAGFWLVTLPNNGAADPGLVGAIESQITSLRVIATFDLPPDAGATGLLFPQYTIKLKYASSAEHAVYVGDLAPTGRGYYVRLDESNVFIVSTSGIDALVNLLVEPPYLPTATPTPTVEVTITSFDDESTATPMP